MPATSQAQQMAMAIALHAPKKLNKSNRGILKMSASQLRDFAKTPRSGLPKNVSRKTNVAEMMGAGH